jgi:hypothetical protein
VISECEQLVKNERRLNANRGFLDCYISEVADEGRAGSVAGFGA